MADSAPADALLAQAEAHAAEGRFDRAAAAVAQALSSDPSHVGALCAQARLTARAGKGARARAMLQHAARLNPASPLPPLGIARLHLEAGQAAPAMRLFHAVQQAHPAQQEAWLGLGEALVALRHPAEAARVLQAGCAALPHEAGLWTAAADALLQAGDAAGAVGHLAQGRARLPGDATLAGRLGLLLLRLDRPAEARPHLAAAAQLDPTDPVLPHNLGLACRALGDLAAAREAGEQAVARAPDHPELLGSLGNTLSELGEHELAVGVLERALKVSPSPAVARTNLGAALLRAGFAERARARLDAALAAQPGLPAALRLRTHAHLARQDEAAAEADLGAALAADPDDGEALALMVALLRRRCDWSALPPLVARLDAANAAALAAGRRAPEPPLDHLTRSLDAAANLAIARSWCAPARPAPPLRRAGGPLQVAYLSADMRDHAMGWLLDGLFAAHDRARVHVTLLDIGPEDCGPQGARLRAGCDAVLRLTHDSDAAAAARIREAGVDVLVDLMGHTRANRIGLLARRPAPIQATWLGHPGTTGAGFIDWILLDPILAPEGEEAAVSEGVARLPCYQANGPWAPLGPAPSRASEGLPAEGPVLACPNRPEKLDPDSFALWMEILRAVPGAVLWLGDLPEAARGHLAAHAEAAGVAPERLRYAARRDKADHLRRLQLVDLGLDTLVYGAHTTASDLLRAGAPMLTVRGPTIASRVAASLLTRCGLDDLLVVADRAAYVDRAVALLTEPGALSRARARVAAGRAALFAPPAMARALEDHFEAWAAAAERAAGATLAPRTP